MIAVFDTIFILALLFIVPVYVMYFTTLYYFGKALAEQQPEVYARITTPATPIIAGGYAALAAIHKNKSLMDGFSQTLRDQYRSTNRYLLLGTLGFLIMVLAAVISGTMSKA